MRRAHLVPDYGRREQELDLEQLINHQGLSYVSQLHVRPSKQLAIVTCMDSRIDVFAVLGLENGEAHILRNGGGVITDDVIRSLAISQRKLGTREVMLIHHTDCGMQKITDDGFRAELQEATGLAPGFAIGVNVGFVTA